MPDGKVYIVAESYYGMGDIIHAVFSTEELGEAFIAKFSPDIENAFVTDWDMADALPEEFEA